MTLRQLAILRAYGGWMLADILIDPDHGIAQAKTVPLRLHLVPGRG
jgi:hypothetical protein